MNLEYLMKMAHSPVRNYVVPGITSWLITPASARGCIRLLECTRRQVEHVTPHSHRFGFWSTVLSGSVMNQLWKPDMRNGDEYAKSELVYKGDLGTYERPPEFAVDRYLRVDLRYREGDSYYMDANEIHSIIFSRGTTVLIQEGPSVTDRTAILEPFVDGARVPTFSVADWMFKKERQA